ncbi:methylated-DNA--protein-cysteine methyltransferase [Pyrococcus yayanosii]|uniref:Methylated-DNA--protein-cysteine methyltransferase n=1 Tax=Pyrococcus yayanosii (strain CH1 / JCM 16557) TaxID=529709 RepID=F8AIH4_PYRYC|nr:methylated-DNA--protein-cysteine methyltransferase [Pyrococcus yayanosii]AEH23794.1 methylated-DNA--protein-cysteine methyltransferase [Pyrococcus yayanosii CH1]
MISIEAFSLANRKILIAVLWEEKIEGITFSLDGKEFLKERITRLREFLLRRGASISLRLETSNYPELVFKILVGEVENREALKELSFATSTPFERRVYIWLAKNVKRGNIITYGEVARALRTSARAIGGAMRRNPYPIVIPCHRVVAKEDLGHYTPKPEYKRFLLEVEGWIG